MKRALLAFSLGILAATILTILPVQAAWAAPNYKVLHAFGAGKDGGGLWTSVTLDKKGDLYGATSGGGAYAYGTVFRLAPHPNGNWTESVLHSFKNGDPDGSEPNGGLVQDPSGKWYGTTSRDGAYHGGTAFQLTHEPNGWKANVIYAFGEKSDDGGFPMAGLIMDGTGNLYGTTPKGSPWSTAFELTPDSGGWKETVIYRFCASSPNCADGTEPQAGLILDAKGNLFGTTAGGGTGCGAGGCGTVYELQRTSSGWKEVVLHRFNNDGKDGVEPGWGALAMNGRGSLYGTTPARAGPRRPPAPGQPLKPAPHPPPTAPSSKRSVAPRPSTVIPPRQR